MIRAGELRHRVRIERPVDTPDAVTGQAVRDWPLEATVWAAIRPLSAREILARDQVQAEVTHHIVMRYRALSSAWRIVFEGRVFEIAAVRNIEERGRMLDVLAVETVAVETG